jgi:beta-galactosidase
VAREIAWGNRKYSCGVWTEIVEPGEGLDVLAAFSNGTAALVRKARRLYLAAWPTRELAADIAQRALDEAGVATTPLDEVIRVRRRGGITFAFNYGSDSREAPANVAERCVLGAQSIAGHNLSAWRS